MGNAAFSQVLQSNLSFKAPCCSYVAHAHVPGSKSALFKIHVAFKQFQVTYIIVLYFIFRAIIL